MTPEEFKSTRKQLRQSQKGLAATLGLSEGRSVRRYENGEREIPGPVSRLMEIFRDHPQLAGKRDMGALGK